eukprot:7242877-Prymnesium_polylepis.1
MAAVSPETWKGGCTIGRLHMPARTKSIVVQLKNSTTFSYNLLGGHAEGDGALRLRQPEPRLPPVLRPNLLEGLDAPVVVGLRQLVALRRRL